MDIQDKSKEEIIKDLQELREEYHSLKILYNKNLVKINQAESKPEKGTVFYFTLPNGGY